MGWRATMLLLWVASLALSCSDGVDGGASAGAGASSGSAQGGAGATGGSAGAAGSGGAALPPPRVLLFTKTAGFRHESIPAAAAALQMAGATRGWTVSHTEDAAWFDAATLGDFDVVVWLLTSGEVLDAAQQAAFEAFVRDGGGYAGVHSASDTGYSWPWYGELVGAYFLGHPSIQTATVRVERRGHPATAGLGSDWQRLDEWYSFQSNPRAEVMVLLSLDESSYIAGNLAMGDHPIAWYHGHDGGRAFYTAGGHTNESYDEAPFIAHLVGGIEWAGGHEHNGAILNELDDGVHPNGAWAPHQSPAFPYQVTPNELLMTDVTGVNQHLVRHGISVDASRPYVIEALFTIPAPADAPPNSFCLNLNLAGADGDTTSVSTWAINVDLNGSGPGGVMKHMGFVNGQFASMGETPIAWGVPGVEYLLRVAVNAAIDGTPAPKLVSTSVYEAGVLRQELAIDYGAFPYQPAPGQTVRVGANTHGTDWGMRGLSVYYLD